MSSPGACWRIDRRRLLLVAVALGTAMPLCGRAAAPGLTDAQRQRFGARAIALRDEALRLGNQPYGALVVKDGVIVGEGVSAVVRRGDAAAHAERLAIADALARLGSVDLAGCVLFGSSRACAQCEAEAARTRIAAMYYGADADSAGAPRSRSVL
jgi:tRNA(Arg) A34 adenosine deaminase TadA